MSSRSVRCSSCQIGTGDFDESLAAWFLLAQHDPLIDDFAGPGIAHALQRDLKAKLATELDLDIADMPGPVDPPGEGGRPDRWARLSVRRERPSPGSDEQGESGETSLPPGGDAEHVGTIDPKTNPSTQRE